MQQIRTIGDHTYRVGLMKTRMGRACFTRFVTSLAPILMAVQAVKDGSKYEIIAEALGSLKGANVDADLDFIEARFSEVTEVEQVATFAAGPKQTWHTLGPEYDDHFAGRYVEYLQWLQFAVEVNFLGFLGARNFDQLFSALAEKVKRSKQAAKEASKSEHPQGSTGSFGASPPTNEPGPA